MASLRSLIMGLASLILSLLVLTQPSEQQYAWRPQGRFGKRADYLSTDIHLPSSRNTNSRIEMLEMPMFETKDVLCVSAGSKGLYRCFTLESGSLSQLDSPFVEEDGILCVSVGNIGSYRCFQLDDDEIAEQSLTNH